MPANPAAELALPPYEQRLAERIIAAEDVHRVLAADMPLRLTPSARPAPAAAGFLACGSDASSGRRAGTDGQTRAHAERPAVALHRPTVAPGKGKARKQATTAKKPALLVRVAFGCGSPGLLIDAQMFTEPGLVQKRLRSAAAAVPLRCASRRRRAGEWRLRPVPGASPPSAAKRRSIICSSVTASFWASVS